MTVNCLTDNRHFCPHLLTFGTNYFCMHPQRLKIVERTADWESDVELLSGLAGQLAAQFASEGKGE